MQDLWSGTYKEPAVWDETAKALIGLADLAGGLHVLDVGSAGGGTLFPALERVGPTGSVVGIEVEGDWVEWLRKEIARREVRNAENLQMDARSMTFPDDAFDAVIVGLVGLDEEYDFDAGRVIGDAPLMREALRVLKPGRPLYNSNWLWQDDNEWMGELVRRHLPDCAKRGYSPGTEDGYRDLLQTVGFDDIRATPFEGHYTFADPSEWMACVGYMWEEELEAIKANFATLRAFEQDALRLLAQYVTDEGEIAYTRSAILVAARKPATP